MEELISFLTSQPPLHILTCVTLLSPAAGAHGEMCGMMAIAAALEARADAFVEAMMGEIGATKGWALFNLGLAAGMVREAAALTTQIGGEVIPSDKPGCLAMALKEPVGVAGQIVPWNYPLTNSFGDCIPALAAGNAVVLKPAEQSPGGGVLLVEALREAGVPPDAIGLLPGYGDVGAALVRDPRVHPIAFTGSNKVGLEIVRAAAETPSGQKHLKRVIAEMGGKNCVIVDGDADLDEGAGAVAGVERLLHDVGVADRLDGHVGAEPAGQLPDRGDRVDLDGGGVAGPLGVQPVAVGCPRPRQQLPAAQPGQPRVQTGHVQVGAQRAQGIKVLLVRRVVDEGAQEHAVALLQVAQQVVGAHLVALVGRVRHAVHQVQQVCHRPYPQPRLRTMCGPSQLATGNGSRRQASIISRWTSGSIALRASGRLMVR